MSAFYNPDEEEGGDGGLSPVPQSYTVRPGLFAGGWTSGAGGAALAGGGLPASADAAAAAPIKRSNSLGRSRGEAGKQFACASCSSLATQNDLLREELVALQARINVLDSPSFTGKTAAAAPRSMHVPQPSMLPSGKVVEIAADELAAMRAIFSLFDEDCDGRISVADLAALHAKMGEPITDEEARDAVATIGQGAAVITFDDFAQYWDGTHPSLRKVAHAATPAAAAVERQRKRQWYQARFKFVKAKLATAELGKVFTETVGPCPSLEYRLFFYYQDGRDRVPISPWHDIPLRNSDGTYNFICEIPKWSRRKFEVATGEVYNPIKQDVKNGTLREYTYGDMLFNYGCLPQTWEDPKHFDADTGCGGDNDPLDLVEVGTKMWSTGSIVRVKLLGVLGLIDQGETDWKIIGISAEDPLAPLLNDIEDLHVHIPGLPEALHRWLKLYKSPAINEFAFDGEARGREYAEHLVAETHEAWRRMLNAHDPSAEPGSAGSPAGVSVKSAGLTRSSSHHRLAAAHTSAPSPLGAGAGSGSGMGGGHGGSIPAAGLTKSASHAKLAGLAGLHQGQEQ